MPGQNLLEASNSSPAFSPTVEVSVTGLPALGCPCHGCLCLKRCVVSCDHCDVVGCSWTFPNNGCACEGSLCCLKRCVVSCDHCDEGSLEKSMVLKLNVGSVFINHRFNHKELVIYHHICRGQLDLPLLPFFVIPRNSTGNTRLSWVEFPGISGISPCLKTL